MTKTLKTLAVLAAFASSSAFAVSIVSPSGPQGEGVLFNGSDDVRFPAPGFPVVGHLNNSGILANFFSPGGVEAPSSGEARVTGAGGATFTALTIDLDDGFSYIELNPKTVPGSQSSGNITFTVNLVGGGGPSPFIVPVGNGQNRVAFQADLGEVIQSLVLSSDVPLGDVRQVRIIATRASVPDGGASVLLLGLGFLGLTVGRKVRS